MPEIELQERLNEILADVRDIRTMLLGSATNPERGVIVRLDRVEQQARGRRWMIHSIFGAAALAIADALSRRFGGHGG